MTRTPDDFAADILDALPGGVVAFRPVRDPSGEIADFAAIHANAAARGLLGSEAGQGLRLLDLVAEEDREPTRARAIEVQDTGCAASVDCLSERTRSFRIDLSRWHGGVLASFAPAGGAAGPGAQGEADLHERLELATEAAGVGIWEYRPAEDLLLWTPTVHRIFGVPPGSFGGRYADFADAVAPEDRGLIEREIANHEAHGVNDHLIRILRPDGSRRWVRTHSRVVARDAAGRPTRIVGTNEDVTAQREAIDRAVRAEARLRAAVDSLPLGIAVYDPENRLAMCNERYREAVPALAEVMVPGARYEDIVRAAVEAGDYGETGEDREALVARKLRERLDPGEETLEARANGRWVRCVSTRASSGDLVVLRIDMTERMNQERALQRALGELSAFTGALDAHALILISDPDGTIRSVNDRLCELSGHVRDQLVGAKTRKLASDLPGASIPREAWSGVAEGRPWRGEVAMRTRSGAIRWIDATAMPLPDETGRHTRILTFGIDVTDRRAMSEALEAAHRQLESVVAMSQVGGWSYDAASGALDWDRQTRRIFRVGPAFTPMRRTIPRFFGAEWPMVEATLFDACLDRGAPYDIEVPIQTLDGTQRWIRAIGEPVRKGSRITGISGVVQDITESKRMRLASERLKARFEAIFENTDAVIFLKDRDGRLLSANSKYREVAGRDDVVGFTDFDLYPPDTARALRAVDDRVFVTGLPFTGEEEVVLASGTRITYMASKFLIPDPELGEMILCGIATDITEQKRLQASLVESRREAEEASRAKSRFLATISHEIRTPMNGVLGMAALLEAALDDPEHRQMAHVIRSSGEILLNVINDVLDISKIGVGKMTLERRPFALSEVAEKVGGIHAPLAAGRGLTFTVEVEPGLETPRLGDPLRLMQILHNLVGNAVKFTEAGGVALRLAPAAEDGVEITVTDTGIGMSRDAVARIFDEFEQGDVTTSRRFGGTGLGLAIVKGLVEAMGGTVEASSERGVGTSIRARLPLPVSAGGAAGIDMLAEAGVRTGVDGAEEPEAAGARVLLVDDNATNRLVLRAMLAALGVRSVSARNGEAALDCFRAERFDLLLIDISMPGMDGVELLAAIREEEAARGLPETPAVAVTAHAFAEQIETYLSTGFAAHLAKPVRREALGEVIAALARREAVRDAPSEALRA